MPQILTAQQIEGQIIENVFESRPIEIDGISISNCFIELKTKNLFQLAYADCSSAAPIESALEHFDFNTFTKFKEAYGHRGCVGRSIRAVVCSECWPSIGLLTEDNQLLYCSDYGTPFRVGPVLDKLGGLYTESDVMLYWTKRALRSG